MPSTFSPSLRIELIGEGEQSGIWGTTTNNNLGDLIEQSIAGRTTIDVTSGDVTLSALNGVTDEARSAVLVVTGTPGVTRAVIIPNVSKSYTVINQTDNIAQIKTTSGVAFNCPANSQSYITCDGSNVVLGRSITDGANSITALTAPFASPAFTGTPTAPTATPGTNTTQLATTAFVTTAVAAGIPAGVITMWSGSIVAIPAGWALCDGTSGRPDLRDRFIVGAGSTYAIGATGGANTVILDTTQIPSHTHTGSGTTASASVEHTHSGSTANTDISHSHSFSASTSSAGDHSHSINDPGHSHSYVASQIGGGGGTTGDNYLATSTSTGAAGTGISINSAGTHSHSLSGTTGSGGPTHAHSFTTGVMSANASHTHTFSFTSAATGGGLAHENRPPYFALAYIIKT